MFYDFERRIANFVFHQKLVELGEIAIRLENVQQVESHIQRVFELFSESTGNDTEEGFVLKHKNHILVVVTKVEERHGGFDFRLSLVLVELLDVIVDILNVDLRKIHGGSDLFCQFSLTLLSLEAF